MLPYMQDDLIKSPVSLHEVVFAAISVFVHKMNLVIFESHELNRGMKAPE